jgi:Domain of unknown function (DUF5664)
MAEQFEPVAVGDLDSDEKGTGARRNGSKPAVELIPLLLIHKSLPASLNPAYRALRTLGDFQERVSPEVLWLIYDDLGATGWAECAQVFDYGRNKYKAWNWAKGMPWSVPIGCAARHLLAMLGMGGFATNAGVPEVVDPESGLPHRGHVFCNIVMLQTYVQSYPEGDDRAPLGYLRPAS